MFRESRNQAKLEIPKAHGQFIKNMNKFLLYNIYNTYITF